MINYRSGASAGHHKTEECWRESPCCIDWCRQFYRKKIIWQVNDGSRSWRRCQRWVGWGALWPIRRCDLQGTVAIIISLILHGERPAVDRYHVIAHHTTILTAIVTFIFLLLYSGATFPASNLFLGGIFLTLPYLFFWMVGEGISWPSSGRWGRGWREKKKSWSRCLGPFEHVGRQWWR